MTQTARSCRSTESLRMAGCVCLWRPSQPVLVRRDTSTQCSCRSYACGEARHLTCSAALAKRRHARQRPQPSPRSRSAHRTELGDRSSSTSSARPRTEQLLLYLARERCRRSARLKESVPLSKFSDRPGPLSIRGRPPDGALEARRLRLSSRGLRFARVRLRLAIHLAPATTFDVEARPQPGIDALPCSSCAVGNLSGERRSMRGAMRSPTRRRFARPAPRRSGGAHDVVQLQASCRRPQIAREVGVRPARRQRAVAACVGASSRAHRRRYRYPFGRMPQRRGDEILGSCNALARAIAALALQTGRLAVAARPQRMSTKRARDCYSAGAICSDGTRATPTRFWALRSRASRLDANSRSLAAKRSLHRAYGAVRRIRPRESSLSAVAALVAHPDSAGHAARPRSPSRTIATSRAPNLRRSNRSATRHSRLRHHNYACRCCRRSRRAEQNPRSTASWIRSIRCCGPSLDRWYYRRDLHGTAQARVLEIEQEPGGPRGAHQPILSVARRSALARSRG